MMTGVVKVKLFIDRLIDEIRRKESHICVGLDPHPDLVPSFLIDQALKEATDHSEAWGKAILTFNKKIIDQVADITVAVKPQIAFYELIGSHGITALRETIKYAHKKGLLVILDAKRNDIGSTAQAYARAYLGFEGQQELSTADAITINPYLGFDGIKPFIKDPAKGAFALLRTSNSTAAEIQDLRMEDGRRVFQAVGDLINKWGSSIRGKNGFSNLGAVVGATYPKELHLLREQLPHCFFLIPGYGVQGGKPGDVVYGFNADGTGALVNSARGIIFAYRDLQFPEEEYAPAARTAAVKMRDEINEVLSYK